MKIDSLAGIQRIEPIRCPACGHLFEQYSGMPGGTLSGTDHGPRTLLLMVCERCETAIVRHEDKMLALTRAQEQQLPAHALASIAAARKIVQAQKRMSPAKH